MRFEDWDLRLDREIEAARDKPFAWGTHDCATWAFAVRAALSGADQAPWTGTYDSRLGAMRCLKSMGYDSLEELGRGLLGEPIEPLMARRGDIVLTDDPDAQPGWPDVFGVCIGEMSAVITREGLKAHLMIAAKMAWRV